MNLIYGDVCSGISAASVAFHPLGWRAAWLAEIEPFPARVLHHHYGSGQPVHMPDPDADGIDEETVTARRANLKAVSVLPTIISPSAPRNLGDMTKIAAMVRAGSVAAPDVLVGGTPCQAFSIAGLRASLGDARGQLSLSFVDLANAIDTARYVRGEPAAVVLWENVPGVLSTADNAFGCFLGALAGEDFPLEPAGGKWTNAGCVYGPQRTVAWRVLDAQYFGVAQRRRRVFVIASARKGFDPTEVLFEFDGVRRDIAPSRQSGEDVAGTLASRTGGGGFPGSDEACSGYVQPVGPQLTCVSNAEGGKPPVFLTCSNLAKTVNNQTPLMAFAIAPVAFAQNSRDEVRLMGGDGQIVGALAAQPGMKQTCYIAQALAFQERGRDGGRSLEVNGDLAYALTAPAGGGRAQERNILTQGMAVRRLTPRECERLQAFPDFHTLIPMSIVKPARAETMQVNGDPVALINGQWWKMSADGPRYKALGNSMCTTVILWLGQQIAIQIEKSNG